MKEAIKKNTAILIEAIKSGAPNAEVEININELPIPVISQFFETTGEGENKEENFSIHQRSDTDNTFDLFRCVVLIDGGSSIEMYSVGFNYKPKKAKYD